MDHNAFFFSIVSAWAVAGIFALSAVVQLFGPGFVRRAYARWELPHRFYLVTALVELIAAALLIDPSTRIWGIALAGLVNFFAVVTLLNNRQYAYTLPGLLIMAALVPATLSAAI